MEHASNIINQDRLDSTMSGLPLLGVLLLARSAPWPAAVAQ